MIFKTDSYDDAINAAAAKYGVPASLIKQVITVESGFNPNAASGTGPVGLMQISKGLAKDYGYSEQDRLDPVKNIDMGARYLKDNLDAFGGDTQKALLGYNQGTGGARQMLKSGNINEEGMKYMNNPVFAPSLRPNAYMRPTIQGGVDHNSDYATTNSASYATPAQAGQAADYYGLKNTASILNMGEAGMNNQESTVGTSKFTPAELTRQGAAAGEAAPNAAVAPAAKSALGTVPGSVDGNGVDKMGLLMQGLNMLSALTNKPQEAPHYAPAPQVGGGNFSPIQNNSLAQQMISRNFQQAYFNPSPFGGSQ